jgi:N-acetylmuramoyl-L-alanine amidase
MIVRLFTSFILAMALILGSIAASPVKEVNAASPVLHMGDQYGAVWDLQHRLQQLGLYKESLDGIFGTNTRWAVINFQQQYGLAVDGVAGSNTWRALYNNTFTKNEIQMLAQMVYGEARGESFEGEVAVAAVMLNRIDSNKFPDSVSGVLFQRGAFAAVADGQYYNNPDSDAYRAVYNAIAGWDPTNSALYYFNPVTATSDWIWSRPQIKQIGKHIFTK